MGTMRASTTAAWQAQHLQGKQLMVSCTVAAAYANELFTSSLQAEGVWHMLQDNLLELAMPLPECACCKGHFFPMHALDSMESPCLFHVITKQT